jgi:sulfoxide reductase heme-binding subunit YedZ
MKAIEQPRIPVVPRSSYWPRRIRRHCGLAVAAAFIVAVAYTLIPSPDVRHRLSMASAYSALAFLVVSLCLGPWNVLRSRPNPISFDLRRDVGVWAGLLALFHTGVGLTVHLRGRMWMYFLKRLHPPVLQSTLFGVANYTGLIAAMLLLLLLLISNDLSLRTLGVRRWKNLQRFSYFAFVFTGAHGVAYQLIEKRRFPWVLVFGLMMLVSITIQASAFRRIKSKVRENLF